MKNLAFCLINCSRYYIVRVNIQNHLVSSHKLSLVWTSKPILTEYSQYSVHPLHSPTIVFKLRPGDEKIITLKTLTSGFILDSGDVLWCTHCTVIPLHSDPIVRWSCCTDVILVIFFVYINGIKMICFVFWSTLYWY